MAYEPCDMRLRYRVGGFSSGKQHRGPTLATSDLRYRVGGGPIASEGVQSHRKRVLTKFQVNLVIPEEHSYGYISTKGRDTYIYGDFNI